MFWILAGAMAAAAAAIVSWRAAAAARGAAARSPGDADVLMHRRQLAELDDLARRDLIAPDELGSARTEAARRLLAAADRAPAPERPGARGSRLAASAGAALAAVLALGLYMKLGAPGVPDAPYASRLKRWRGADPTTLGPAQLAAVLQDLAAERPNDARLFEYLGRAQLAAGEPGLAARAFDHAARLAPRNANYPAEAGEALLEGNEGRAPAEATAAFREALRRDPRNPAARYHLARVRIAAGDLAGGLSDWRALAVDLPSGDPRRAWLESEIARASSPVAPGAGAMPDLATVAAAARSAPGAGPGQRAFIRSMVARLDARLRDHPGDPDGWLRLVRAYGVLGDAPAQAQALTRARRALASRPEALAALEAQTAR